MTNSSNYRAVFISPHLDDAAFSCAGEIARLRLEGKVLVINIFTKYLSDKKTAAILVGRERYDEEEAAARILDYEHINLDELDVYFRHPRFHSVGNIFLPPAQDQREYISVVKKSLNDILSNISFDSLYVPLGIGWHTDHNLTFLSMVDSPYREKMLYYEDAPYCFIKNATDFRLGQLLAKPVPYLLFLKRWWETSVSHYTSAMVQNIDPPWVKYFSFPFTAGYLYHMIKTQLSVAPPGPVIDLNYLISDVSPFFEKKVQAILAYKSQVKLYWAKTLFGAEPDIRFRYLKHSASINPDIKHCERFWRRVL